MASTAATADLSCHLRRHLELPDGTTITASCTGTPHLNECMINAIYSVHQFPHTSLTGVRRSCQLLQRLPRLPSTPCTPQQSPHAQRHAKPIMYARREMANKNPYSTYRQQSWIIIPTLRADCFRTQKCSQHVSMSKIKLTFLSSYFRVIISPFQFPLLVCFCCMANRTWFFCDFSLRNLGRRWTSQHQLYTPKNSWDHADSE